MGEEGGGSVVVSSRPFGAAATRQIALRCLRPGVASNGRRRRARGLSASADPGHPNLNNHPPFESQTLEGSVVPFPACQSLLGRKRQLHKRPSLPPQSPDVIICR